MGCVKAVIFDYIGTLLIVKVTVWMLQEHKLYTSLVAEGFKVEQDRFLEAYIRAHEKYRKVRYEQLREVTNAIWVAEALMQLGFKVARRMIRELKQR